MDATTHAYVTVYACPPDEAWAVAQVLAHRGFLSGHEPTDYAYTDRVALGACYAHEGCRAGLVSDMASELAQVAENAVWSAYECPSDGYLGEIATHVPSLSPALWSAPCDGEGDILVSAKDVSEVLDDQAARAKLLGSAYTAVIERIAGGLAVGSNGAPCQWVVVPQPPDPCTAHIITADAQALGDPAILVFQHDESGTGRLVERLDLLNAQHHDGCDVDASLAGKWRYDPGQMTCVASGYWIVDVERAS